jgi:hypothetical protein
MGLTLAEKFTREARGELQIQSIPNFGTAVSLYLPAVHIDALPNREGETEEESDAPSVNLRFAA